MQAPVTDFVFEIANEVDAIFEALSACAALHPDPAGDSDDDMGLGDDDAFADAEFDPSELITGEGEGPELTEAGRVRSDFTNDTRYRPY